MNVIAKQTDVMIDQHRRATSTRSFTFRWLPEQHGEGITDRRRRRLGEKVKNGTYPIARAVQHRDQGRAERAPERFYQLNLSARAGGCGESYTRSRERRAYACSKPSGKIDIRGLNLVTPIMEKLKEAYLQLNPDVTMKSSKVDSPPE